MTWAEVAALAIVGATAVGVVWALVWSTVKLARDRSSTPVFREPQQWQHSEVSLSGIPVSLGAVEIEKIIEAWQKDVGNNATP